MSVVHTTIQARGEAACFFGSVNILDSWSLDVRWQGHGMVTCSHLTWAKLFNSRFSRSRLSCLSPLKSWYHERGWSDIGWTEVVLLLCFCRQTVKTNSGTCTRLAVTRSSVAMPASQTLRSSGCGCVGPSGLRCKIFLVLPSSVFP